MDGITESEALEIVFRLRRAAFNGTLVSALLSSGTLTDLECLEALVGTAEEYLDVAANLSVVDRQDAEQYS